MKTIFYFYDIYIPVTYSYNITSYFLWFAMAIYTESDISMKSKIKNKFVSNHIPINIRCYF